MTIGEAKAQLEIMRESMRVNSADYIVTALDMAIKVLEQEPKVGHWIGEESLDGSIHYMCDNCKEFEYVNYYDYCPNCGAKMESEDKE